MIKITEIMSEVECYNKLRALKYSDGEVACPRCSSVDCRPIQNETPSDSNRHYACHQCGRHFNDLTDTIFQFSNLSLIKRQIAQELGVSAKTAQNMTDKIRTEIQENNPSLHLSGELILSNHLAIELHPWSTLFPNKLFQQ